MKLALAATIAGFVLIVASVALFSIKLSIGVAGVMLLVGGLNYDTGN